MHSGALRGPLIYGMGQDTFTLTFSGTHAEAAARREKIKQNFDPKLTNAENARNLGVDVTDLESDLHRLRKARDCPLRLRKKGRKRRI